MTKRSTYTIIAILIAAIGVAAIVIWVLRGGTGPHVITLRLKWLFDPGFAGEMVADKSGLFKGKGLNVKIEPGGFESDPIKLVASGSDDFGHAGADSFLLARASGVPVVALAAGYLATPVVFYVHADSGINSPRDFVGKRVGYQAGQDTATVYEALLKKVGVAKTDVKEVPVKYDLTPFLTGDVDVWPGYAATQSYILQGKGIPFRVIKPSDYGVSYLGTVYFTSQKQLAQHKDIAQRLICAIVEGWKQTYADPARAVSYIESFDPKSLTPDLITYNLAAQQDQILPPGRQYGLYNADDWNSTIAILRGEGLLARDITLSTAVDFDLVSNCYAHKQQE